MEEFIERWQFVRSETLELLLSLFDEQLQYKPSGEKWQPIYYQFGCIGRTQQIYTAALVGGKMDFSLFGSPTFAKKDTNQTNESIRIFLKQCNDSWLGALHKNFNNVAWPNGVKSSECQPPQILNT